MNEIASTIAEESANKQTEVDMKQLETFMLSFQIPTIHDSVVTLSMEVIADYHTRFVAAIEFISTYVHQRNLPFGIHNNDFVDKVANIVTNILILFLSNSLKRKLDYETNAVFGKVVTQGQLSPNRQIIRDEVSDNIIKNGERVKVKYSKRKRVKIGDYEVGDNVAVKIPPIDRSKCDAIRIPCVIIAKKGNVQPRYKVSCCHGLIEGLYTASSLVMYPGKVYACQTEKNVTLREAARLHTVHKTEVTFCKCKTGCKTKRCPCKKNDVACLSRCHKGHKCTNSMEAAYTMKNTTLVLPSWGGQYKHNSCAFSFSNMCPIDNWFVLLRMASLVYPELYANILDSNFSKNSDFIGVMGLIEKSYFDIAKYRLAVINNIQCVKNCFNFYGDEFSNFIEHLTMFTSHNVISGCSSKQCISPHQSEYRYSIPSAVADDPEEFTKMVKEWLLDTWSSPCKLPLAQPLPDDEELIFWSYNNEE